MNDRARTVEWPDEVPDDVDRDYCAVLGWLLEQARAQRGLDQFRVAERIGAAPATLSCYEIGRRKPSLPALVSLSAVLRVDVWELLVRVALLVWTARGAPSDERELMLWAVMRHQEASAVRDRTRSERSTDPWAEWGAGDG